MAYPVVFNIGTTSVQWFITDLGGDWNVSNYQYVYITLNGNASAPVYPPPTGTSRTTGTGTVSGLSPGTFYNVQGFAVVPSGDTYPAGSTSFTTLSVRPPYFSWDSSKFSGQPFNITANEWTRLQNNVNQVRAYKAWPYFAFTPVSSGMLFTAGLYNEVVIAIASLSPPLSPPPTRSSGELIYANDINRLRDSINSIS